ncbi:MAG: acyl-ACP--UDP-N-acetylglucosamine O-acyltransferase [Phycisphaerae bacterium]|nr:acyl-ACP--UDP-N-acetylglucosamine O-acyltransferase [Phycisphaerae bacterium]
MPSIHPSAQVSPDCEIADSAEIGPYCVLTGRVRLADGVRLLSHVCLAGPVSIGAGTILYPFACIGFPGQDVKFKPGDKTAGVVVGQHGTIREHATIHAATNEHTPTTVGDRVFMMVNAHFGHDAQVGNGVTMVNDAAIGGHARLFDNVTMGGGAKVHQFCRVGRMAFMSGNCVVSTEVPPFCIAAEFNRVVGINLVGLRRAGVPREEIAVVRKAFARAIRPGPGKVEMLAILRELAAQSPLVAEMADFVAAAKRPITPGMGKPSRAMINFVQRSRRGNIDPATVADDEEEWS